MRTRTSRRPHSVADAERVQGPIRGSVLGRVAWPCCAGVPSPDWRGVEQLGQLAGLITRRSQVQILPPLRHETPRKPRLGGASGVQGIGSTVDGPDLPAVIGYGH